MEVDGSRSTHFQAICFLASEAVAMEEKGFHKLVLKLPNFSRSFDGRKYNCVKMPKSVVDRL